MKLISQLSDNTTSEYIKSVDQSDGVLLSNKLKFQSYLMNWQKKTLFLSSPKAIIENVDFQSIVAMGQFAIPFIIEEIDHKPSTLVWALNLIYNRKVTDNPNITISDACKLWVKEVRK